MINVDLESENDPFYRYKMPKVVIKIEGGGNGIKTVLTNLELIAKAVFRKPEEILKYVAQSLGSNSISKGGKYIVNGEFSRETVQTKIFSFITSNVLCPKCRNPETTVTLVKKTRTVNCQACGAI